MDSKQKVLIQKAKGLPEINQQKERDRLAMKQLGITSRKAFKKRFKKLAIKDKLKNAKL